MINSVWNTVLAILQKNNYGTITPSDFNLWALQAQLERFQDYFNDYNRQINLENARRSGTDMADISKEIAECIETFSVSKFLNNSSNNTFSYPSLATTGDIAYMIGKILTYTEELAIGANTSIVANQLVATAGGFSSTTIKANDIVINTTDGTVARVVAVLSATEISLTADIFTATPESYKVISARSPREADKITHGKATMLNTSLLTFPNTTFPAYTLEGQLLTLFPSTINLKGQVEAQYYRYPTPCKWTYVSLIGGAPVFDQSQPDYMDFELPEGEETNLVIKICQYAGLSLREQQVVEFAKREQQENDQPKM